MVIRATRDKAPFGLWPSPISPRALTRGARRFGHVQGAGPFVYWSEGRPDEAGRQVIVRARPGQPPEDLLPQPFSARSHVHEYGGAEFLVDGETVYFVEMREQDVWRVTPGSAPERITAEPTLRFADLELDRERGRLLAVAERHFAGNDHQHPENLLVSIALDGRARGTVIDAAAGRDFYAFPRLSPDGRRLAYLAWDLPDMPWDQSALMVAPVRGDGSIGRAERIAGGKGVAAMQPQWLDDGRLVFLSDATGFGNVMLWDGAGTRPLTRLKSELGLPMWNLGVRTMLVTGPDEVSVVAAIDGTPSVLGLSNLSRQRPTTTVDPMPALAGTGAVATYDGGLAMFAGRPAAPAALLARPNARKTRIVLRQASEIALDPRGLSKGRTVSFRGGDRKTTFAQYYPPASATHRGPAGSRPPAVVLAHGGPTASAGRGLALRVQYFTSRGFAVLDVDYSGSTGYGRAYRERLDGEWGIADVADCAAGAHFLGNEGLADPARIAIAGGSAGGYTVLMALATTEVFAAGSSHYGISDLSLLMQSTHKFEAGYLHRLLGTTPGRWRRIAEARSPITRIGAMTAPLILFQGLDDRVVPPDQSRLIRERLSARGIKTELHEFAGEGHGFRQASTIVTVARAELAFLKKAMRIGKDR
jgi:dipeptidyl aminopeptidase/acylaminoacyl peptidase